MCTTRVSIYFTAVILTVVSLLAQCSSRGLPSPVYTGTREQYERARRRVEARLQATKNDENYRPGAESIYRFHSADTPVHGTVMVFHGGFATPASFGVTIKYLYDNGFNVYAPALAGHAYNSTRWPYALLRPEMGGRAAKKVLTSDPVIGGIIDRINNGSMKPPVFAPNGFDLDEIIVRADRLLRQGLSDDEYENLQAGMSLLVREDHYPWAEKDIHKYFETDYYRYDSDPYERFSEIASLPGPTYAVGYSLGGLQTMYLAARAKSLRRIVLLAPYAEVAAPKDFPQSRYLVEAVGALDLYKTQILGANGVPSRAIPAVDLAGRFLLQDDILRPIRDSTATFCIFAEDDPMSDPTVGLDACSTRVRNNETKTFVYPAEAKVGHNVAPGESNRFSTPVLQEMLRFLTAGSVHENNMLKVQGDPKLPAPSPIV